MSENLKEQVDRIEALESLIRELLDNGDFYYSAIEQAGYGYDFEEWEKRAKALLGIPEEPTEPMTVLTPTTAGSTIKVERVKEPWSFTMRYPIADDPLADVTVGARHAVKVLETPSGIEETRPARIMSRETRADGFVKYVVRECD